MGRNPWTAAPRADGAAGVIPPDVDVVNLADVSETSESAVAVGPGLQGFGHVRDRPLPGDSQRVVLALQRTAGNQAVARWLGGLLPGCQPEPVAPPEPDAGAINKARAEVIEALKRTAGQLKPVIAEWEKSGFVPETMTATLCRFFPGSDTDFLYTILSRVETMSGRAPGIEVLPPQGHRRPTHRDADLIMLIEAQAEREQPEMPAFSVIRSAVGKLFPGMPMAPGDDYVVLRTPWDADADLQATRLLHEFFHVCFDGMIDRRGNPLTDADAWQGFVSVVAGLKTGEGVGEIPACP